MSTWIHIEGSFISISHFCQQASSNCSPDTQWHWGYWNGGNFCFPYPSMDFPTTLYRENVNIFHLLFLQGRSFTAQLCIVCKEKICPLTCVVRNICCSWFLYQQIEWAFDHSPFPHHIWLYSHTILVSVIPLARS